MALNEGWYFEGPDPEVGIFGDLIVHEACTAVAEGDDVPDAEQVDVTIKASTTAGVENIVTTFRCPACGATTQTTDQQPSDHFKEPRA